MLLFGQKFNVATKNIDIEIRIYIACMLEFIPHTTPLARTRWMII